MVAELQSSSESLSHVSFKIGLHTHTAQERGTFLMAVVRFIRHVSLLIVPERLRVCYVYEGLCLNVCSDV